MIGSVLGMYPFGIADIHCTITIVWIRTISHRFTDTHTATDNIFLHQKWSGFPHLAMFSYSDPDMSWFSGWYPPGCPTHRLHFRCAQVAGAPVSDPGTQTCPTVKWSLNQTGILPDMVCSNEPKMIKHFLSFLGFGFRTSPLFLVFITITRWFHDVIKLQRLYPFNESNRTPQCLHLFI